MLKTRILKSLFFLIFVLLCIYISIKANQYPDKLIWSDMEGYYVYLPAMIVHGGFDGMQVKDTSYLKPWSGTQKIYSKYTYGIALMELPFFLAAHVLSRPLGYPADGYSMIYSYALMAAGICYLIFGLLFLEKVLKKYFSSTVTYTALLGLVFGTNLYYYTFYQPAMSHVYSFFLVALLIWITEKISGLSFSRVQVKWTDWVIFGFAAALIVLIRPTNIIILLYPLYRFWKEGFFEGKRIQELWNPVLIIFLLFCIVWFPQILYWKSVTGDFLKWSYGQESFKYWQEPKLIRVLIDPWNGWLLYSPMVLMPLVGLWLRSRYSVYYNKIILVILLLATYIFASWWAWWFGGAFGHRSYVEFLALLALPFAQIADISFTKKRIVFFMIIYLFFIYYNIGLTSLYIPPWDGPNWTYESVWNEIRKLF